MLWTCGPRRADLRNLLCAGGPTRFVALLLQLLLDLFTRRFRAISGAFALAEFLLGVDDVFQKASELRPDVVTGGYFAQGDAQ